MLSVRICIEKLKKCLNLRNIYRASYTSFHSFYSLKFAAFLRSHQRLDFAGECFLNLCCNEKLYFFFLHADLHVIVVTDAIQSNCYYLAMTTLYLFIYSTKWFAVSLSNNLNPSFCPVFFRPQLPNN